MESNGIIMFNRGNKCIIRAIVCLNTLRKWWDGNVTFYLETPYPSNFDEVCKFYNVDIIHNIENHGLKTLVRKTDMFGNPPYEKTLWIDSDTVVVGKIDEMFEYLDGSDICIPHFAGWISSGHSITKRIKRFEGIISPEYIEESLKGYPAVNTGVLSFRKTKKWKNFVEYWVKVADQASKKGVFIPDEVAFQVLYPNAQDWGLFVSIAPMKFNVSVKHDPDTKDKRIIHYHGQKHVLNLPLCDLWKNEFKEMCEKNTADINSFLPYVDADKRLKRYMNGEEVWGGEGKVRKKRIKVKGNQVEENKEVTIVTACDENYVDILRETFANWRKYKNIDNYPVIVFVHGIPPEDSRLDFLKLPNVTIVPWKMENAETHREEMLSAFVFGPAEYVKTGYWMKLDADSYATDNRPLFDDGMKEYAFCGHKWGYSRPEHIKLLDEWAKGHWKPKLKNAKPMMEEGRIEHRRFYHNVKRTISYVQLHKTRFSKFCIKLLKERKLPCPSQDTYMFYVANRFNPESVGIRNFKRDYGFTQGKGKMGVDHIRKKLQEVEAVQLKSFTKEVANEVSDKKIDLRFPPVSVVPEGKDYFIEFKEIRR